MTCEVHYPTRHTNHLMDSIFYEFINLAGLIFTESAGCRAAIGAHRGFRPRRDASRKVVGSPHRKTRHQFFDLALTDRTIYRCVVGPHQAIKFVIAFLTVIFVNRHDFSPMKFRPRPVPSGKLRA